MSEIKDGGCAFPFVDGFNQPSPGMTLRDYFAAKALVGICHFWVQARTEVSTIADPNPKIVAEMAYEFADAMLEAREL